MSLAGAPILVTPPLEELSLSLVKSYLRIDYSDDDAILTMLIQSARERCEAICNRKFITQVYRCYYDKITKRFQLPFPPIQSVDNFNLIYLQETIALVDNSDYYLMNTGGDAFVILTATTYNLPPGFSVNDDLWRFNISIDVTMGYSDTYAAGGSPTAPGVPMGIQEAIMKTVGSAYFSPRANTFGAARAGVIDIIEVPEDAKYLLSAYKNYTI